MAHSGTADDRRCNGSADGVLCNGVFYRPLGMELTDMTETQLLLLLGTIWVAPHCNKIYNLVVGGIFIIVAACKGLGWV
jgi:hypothetical protein